MRAANARSVSGLSLRRFANNTLANKTLGNKSANQPLRQNKEERAAKVLTRGRTDVVREGSSRL